MLDPKTLEEIGAKMSALLRQFAGQGHREERPRGDGRLVRQTRSGHPRRVRYPGEVLARTREKLKALEARVDELEKARAGAVSRRCRSPSSQPRAGRPMRRRSRSRSISPAACRRFTLVGLPDTEVKEARDRVRAAIQNCGFEFPARRITVNLAPADLPKESGRFDLPIALGILAASGQIPGEARWTTTNSPANCRCPANCGRCAARWPCALAGRRQRQGLRAARGQRAEAALIGSGTHPAGRLAARGLRPPRGQAALGRSRVAVTADNAADLSRPRRSRGQAQAKRALEVAAAGGHSLLMIGPPGTGKSMLAARLPGLLPPMTRDEALEVGAVHSLAGQFQPERLAQRPYPLAAPHGLGGRAGRRRQRAASGRDFAGPSRRAVPRRTARVRARGAGSPARAARNRPHPHRPRRAPGRISRRDSSWSRR